MTRTIESATTADCLATAVVTDILSGVEDTELELLAALVDWEQFRSVLESIWVWTVAAGGRGRPSWAAVQMFKVLVYGKFQKNLSDVRLERACQVNLATTRLVGLDYDQSPEAKTIHKYRSVLSASGRLTEVFEVLTALLAKKGYELDSALLIDSSLVASPVPRQLVKKPDDIKASATRDGAAAAAASDPGSPAVESPAEAGLTAPQARQLDRDARWVKRPGKSVHGYKNHVVVDKTHKFMVTSGVTPANVHDRQVALGLLAKVPIQGAVYADRGYDSESIRSGLRALGHDPRIAARAPRHSRETEAMKAQRLAANQKLSRPRVRVEQVLATLKHNRGCRLPRRIGLARAQAEILLENVAYNRRRFVSLAAKLTR